MKKMIYFLIILLTLFIYEKSNTQTNISVKGKKFIGNPVQSRPESGFEGGGQRGYFKFSSDSDSVEFVWPESDEINTGSYKQINFKLVIKSVDGEIFNFTISHDGKEIKDDKNKIVFRVSNS